MTTEQQKHLNDLNEIRTLMERSSRFISLSGLSGVFAGVYALIGAGLAFQYFKMSIVKSPTENYLLIFSGNHSIVEVITFCGMVGFAVLFLAIATGIFLTSRKAKKLGHSIWDKTAWRLVLNMAIPLATGGIFSLILLYKGLYFLPAPITLIFYGLALVNASKYTYGDVRYLGYIEIVLGLIATAFVGYSFLLWVAGFGIMHIVYGIVMYYKYERKLITNI